jgi:hypothetical protein
MIYFNGVSIYCSRPKIYIIRLVVTVCLAYKSLLQMHRVNSIFPSNRRGKKHLSKSVKISLILEFVVHREKKTRPKSTTHTKEH